VDSTKRGTLAEVPKEVSSWRGEWAKTILGCF